MDGPLKLQLVPTAPNQSCKDCQYFVLPGLCPRSPVDHSLLCGTNYHWENIVAHSKLYQIRKDIGRGKPWSWNRENGGWTPDNGTLWGLSDALRNFNELCDELGDVMNGADIEEWINE